MTRRRARELALCAIFSIEVGHHDPAEVLDPVLAHNDVDEHRSFIRELVLGTHLKREDLDRILAPLLEGWTIERLPTVDLLLLRMGIFEMRYSLGTPHPVVINEAVELAKKFSTDDSGRFINGVLASVSKAS
ncbi:MAG TPA: transcription antitermination factor NusB [Candidatus Baltobacteraceae bacterium]|jgi:N utilization substance protein B|nr:transcription antitermination factor NusB [Candidatus Baltobacteraceae bacterium]